MTWAFGLDLKPATAKFVLVALADNADDEGRAFPSIASLIAKTSLDRKTVIHALDELERLGLLVDTGSRVGQTKQVKVYRLDWKKPEIGTVSVGGERVPKLPEDTETGTVPKIPANSTEIPLKGTVFPPKESQKRDTEPSGNHQEPSGNRQRARKRASRRAPPEFAVTSEMREWAEREAPRVDLLRETARFRDCEFRTAHSDWVATWRNWMRTAQERIARPNGKPSFGERLAALSTEGDGA